MESLGALNGERSIILSRILAETRSMQEIIPSQSSFHSPAHWTTDFGYLQESGADDLSMLSPPELHDACVSRRHKVVEAQVVAFSTVQKVWLCFSFFLPPFSALHFSNRSIIVMWYPNVKETVSILRLVSR